MSPDHRPAVAAKRRAQMRRRLTEAAIRVIAKNGPDSVVIDTVIAEAQVSRGTFYKYFETVADVMTEAKETLGAEMLRLVLSAERPSEDIVECVACDILRFIATSIRYPIAGQFAAKLGFHGLGQGNLLHELAPDYLERGMDCGRFCRMSEQIALDIMQLAVIAALKRHDLGHSIDPQEVVAALLRMLGVPAEEADRASQQKVAALIAPDTSLIASSEMLRSPANKSRESP